MEKQKDIFDRIMMLPLLSKFAPFYKKHKSVLLYLLFSCLFGVISKEDVLALPMGERIYSILKIMRLLPLTKDV